MEKSIYISADTNMRTFHISRYQYEDLFIRNQSIFVEHSISADTNMRTFHISRYQYPRTFHIRYQYEDFSFQPIPIWGHFISANTNMRTFHIIRYWYHYRYKEIKENSIMCILRGIIYLILIHWGSALDRLLTMCIKNVEKRWVNFFTNWRSKVKLR